MQLTFNHKESPAKVADTLIAAIPALASGRVPEHGSWRREHRLILPNHVEFTVRAQSSHGYSREDAFPLEEVRMVYSYGYGARKVTIRRAVKFNSRERYGAPVALDVDAVRVKLAEVMEFAEAAEVRRKKVEESVNAGEQFAKASHDAFLTKLAAAGLPVPESREFSNAAVRYEHDTRKDMARPVHLMLRLTDEQAIEVLRLIHGVRK